MKKTIYLILSFAFILSGCASLRLTPEEKESIARQVQENLDNRTYVINVERMNPQRGASKMVNDFSLAVDGDKLISRLPYFGTAWNLPYGGGKGLNFESKITDYIETFPKADRRQIAIATNNGEDSLVFIILVFDNGKATIDLRSRNRESISYYGTVETTLQ